MRLRHAHEHAVDREAGGRGTTFVRYLVVIASLCNRSGLGRRIGLSGRRPGTITQSFGRFVTGLLFHRRITPRSAPRVGACIGHSPHERRVEVIALKLFDLLRARHNLDEAHRKLLSVAALVHDAAKESSPADHDVRGAELVLADRSLPLSPSRRRAVAMLVRYHRNAGGARGAAASVPGYDPRSLLLLLALLHAADGLDSRRVPLAAIVARRKGGTLDIVCLVTRKLARARRLLARPRKFRLLQRMLGIEVRVSVERALQEECPR